MIRMSDVSHMYKSSLANGHPETTKVLQGLLMLGLGQKQGELMRLMLNNGTMRCAEVAEAMNINRNTAGMMLYKLTEYGLLQHEEIRDSCGVHYRWRDVTRKGSNGSNGSSQEVFPRQGRLANLSGESNFD